MAGNQAILDWAEAFFQAVTQYIDNSDIQISSVANKISIMFPKLVKNTDVDTIAHAIQISIQKIND